MEEKSAVWQTWWKRLREDRAGRAELARCGKVAEVAFFAPFHQLRRMRGNPTTELELKTLGLIAAVLSHVDIDDDNAGSLARQMGSLEGEKPVVSDARFRQLLRVDADEADERLVMLIRVLRQLGGRASVTRLATDLFWWNERTKRRWALDYYGQAAPTRTGE